MRRKADSTAASVVINRIASAGFEGVGALSDTTAHAAFVSLLSSSFPAGFAAFFEMLTAGLVFSSFAVSSFFASGRSVPVGSTNRQSVWREMPSSLHKSPTLPAFGCCGTSKTFTTSGF